jgi:putative IMPACT (imprinted ancient) family translation regulator
MMELPYSFYERVHSGIKDFYGEILEESFSSEVVISARFPVDNLSDFRAYVQNFSRGELNLLILEETESIIPSSRYKTDRND